MGSKRFEIAELKQMLGLIDRKGNEQFTEITAFKKKVLDIAKKQLNENTDIEFDYELKKRGRSFHWITIYVNHRKFNQMEIDFKKPIADQKYVRSLIAYGFNEEQAFLIASKVKREEIEETDNLRTMK